MNFFKILFLMLPLISFANVEMIEKIGSCDAEDTIKDISKLAKQNGMAVSNRGKKGNTRSVNIDMGGNKSGMVTFYNDGDKLVRGNEFDALNLSIRLSVEADGDLTRVKYENPQNLETDEFSKLDVTRVRKFTSLIEDITNSVIKQTCIKFKSDF